MEQGVPPEVPYNIDFCLDLLDLKSLEGFDPSQPLIDLELRWIDAGY